jgi:hypothetical protein
MKSSEYRRQHIDRDRRAREYAKRTNLEPPQALHRLLRTIQSAYARLRIRQQNRGSRRETHTMTVPHQ